MAEMILGAGWPLHVWARRPETTEPFAKAGATVLASPAELGARCELVSVCVVADADVEQVVFDGGLLEAMQPGSVLAIHSTVAPATPRRVAEAASGRGVAVLDAPVSG